ncbi:monovalent cation:proton antiporter-2 (CPA2) family protein [Hyphomicrobium sp.]|uniref:monovalent cation:proton antiporter-2 (CPA2) family protein n=1 Tax=Hyphomicrobium sp. TaxID=82 RepID=UPI002FDFD5FB
MPHVTLYEVVLLLAAMAIAPPLARRFGIGTVLGYLLAGILLGPHVFRHFFTAYDAHEILELSEFGIVLLLFLIGLELRPKRLWAMRNAIFRLGGAQVLLTGLVLAAAAAVAGLGAKTALFVGLVLALSSTAFALQLMEEQGDLATRHGRLGFAVLLFQDLAAIPLIAFVPLFATTVAEASRGMDLAATARGVGAIVSVVLIGHFALDKMLRLVARTQVKEAMTAAGLLTVVGVAMLMQMAGLSAALGAFIAGALLAESSYRHQLEADLQPFQGLLLGLFFTAVGMSMDLTILLANPGKVLLLAAALVVTKTLILYGLGRLSGLEPRAARRLGLLLSQGGEFAFVLLTASVAANVLSDPVSDLLILVVTISMAATPLLLQLEKIVTERRRPDGLPAYDDMLPAKDEHVVIAGFGRYGQIVARILRGKKIPFIALEISSEQVHLVQKFGSRAFYGDASRPEILEAAQIGKARAFVIAIDDIEASLRAAEYVRTRHPEVPIFARARNRNHAHQLLDVGVTSIQRETFLSALETTREILVGLGYAERESDRVIETFRAHDERRLMEDYAHYSDVEKLQAKARSDVATLEQLFAEDAEEQAREAADARAAARPVKPLPSAQKAAPPAEVPANERSS